MHEHILVEEEQKEAPKRSFALITRRWALLATICTSPVFFLFAFFGDPGRGMAAAIATGMITVAVRYFWDLKRHLWFWITIGLTALLHVPLVWFIPWPDNQYTYIQLLPLALLDFAIVYGVIRLAENAIGENS